MPAHLRTLVLNLVLNRNYQPINVFPLEVIHAEDAVARIVAGTCTSVADYDRPILTPTVKMNWPAVIGRNDAEIVFKDVPGKRPKNSYLLYRDKCRCAYCLRPLNDGRNNPDRITIDHVIPKAAGGKNVWDNVVAACEECNNRKGNRDPVGEWEPKTRVYHPTYWDLLRERKNFPIDVDSEHWIDFLGPWNSEIVVKNVG